MHIWEILNIIRRKDGVIDHDDASLLVQQFSAPSCIFLIIDGFERNTVKHARAITRRPGPIGRPGWV